MAAPSPSPPSSPTASQDPDVSGLGPSGPQASSGRTHIVALTAQNQLEELWTKIIFSEEHIKIFRNILMKEFVSYKNRLDDRLNEIRERASANKREVESLAEEKYKRFGDRSRSSKLTIEEATFHDIQVHDDRTQSDLEELVKEWNRITCVKEPTLDVQNIIAPPKEKFKSDKKEKVSTGEGLAAAASSLNADSKSKKQSSSISEHVHQGESSYAHSADDSARSPPGSSTGRSTLETGETHIGKSFEVDASPRAKESHGDNGGAEFVISGDKSFDEPTWGTFDTKDDTDSGIGSSDIDTSEPEKSKDDDEELVLWKENERSSESSSKVCCIKCSKRSTCSSRGLIRGCECLRAGRLCVASCSCDPKKCKNR